MESPSVPPSEVSPGISEKAARLFVSNAKYKNKVPGLTTRRLKQSFTAFMIIGLADKMTGTYADSVAGVWQKASTSALSSISAISLDFSFNYHVNLTHSHVFSVPPVEVAVIDMKASQSTSCVPNGTNTELFSNADQNEGMFIEPSFSASSFPHGTSSVFFGHSVQPGFIGSSDPECNSHFLYHFTGGMIGNFSSSPPALSECYSASAPSFRVPGSISLGSNDLDDFCTESSPVFLGHGYANPFTWSGPFTHDWAVPSSTRSRAAILMDGYIGDSSSYLDVLFSIMHTACGFSFKNSTYPVSRRSFLRFEHTSDGPAVYLDDLPVSEAMASHLCASAYNMSTCNSNYISVVPSSTFSGVAPTADDTPSTSLCSQGVPVPGRSVSYVTPVDSAISLPSVLGAVMSLSGSSSSSSHNDSSSPRRRRCSCFLICFGIGSCGGGSSDHVNQALNTLTGDVNSNRHLIHTLAGYDASLDLEVSHLSSMVSTAFGDISSQAVQTEDVQASILSVYNDLLYRTEVLHDMSTSPLTGLISSLPCLGNSRRPCSSHLIFPTEAPFPAPLLVATGHLC
jgi:hypothetical protein